MEWREGFFWAMYCHGGECLGVGRRKNVMENIHEGKGMTYSTGETSKGKASGGKTQDPVRVSGRNKGSMLTSQGISLQHVKG